VKANIDGSVVGLNASCSGIFRDFRSIFMGCFEGNLGDISDPNCMDCSLPWSLYQHMVGDIYVLRAIILVMSMPSKSMISFLIEYKIVGIIVYIHGFRKFAKVIVVRISSLIINFVLLV